MCPEQEHRAGRTYVEPGELEARERARDTHHRHQADGATGDQQESEAGGTRPELPAPDAD